MTTPSRPAGKIARIIRIHCRAGHPPRREAGALIGERPLLLKVFGFGSFTIMRTPGDEIDLAVGFLLAEGIIEGMADLRSVAFRERSNDEVHVYLERPPAHGRERNLVVNASCGLCGSKGLDELLDRLDPIDPEGIRVPLEVFYHLPRTLRSVQTLFGQTGGCHAAALFDAEGKILACREDLGRHNAVDKVIGHALRCQLPLPGCGLFLSGRVSLEMTIKAARAGIGLVVAVSAPSDAAHRCAEELGITLAGFARGEEVAIYTHPHRIVGIPSPPAGKERT